MTEGEDALICARGFPAAADVFAAAETVIAMKALGTAPNATSNRNLPIRATVFPAATGSIAAAETVIVMKALGTAMNATSSPKIRVRTFHVRAEEFVQTENASVRQEPGTGQHVMSNPMIRALP